MVITFLPYINFVTSFELDLLVKSLSFSWPLCQVTLIVVYVQELVNIISDFSFDRRIFSFNFLSNSNDLGKKAAYFVVNVVEFTSP